MSLRPLQSLVQRHGSKFLRFVVCGGLGACIDFGTLYVLVQIMAMPEKYALLFSTGFAMIFVFFANRLFTFKASGNAHAQAMKFLSVYLVAAFLNYVLSLTFIQFGVHYLLAKALAVGIIMFFNFFSLNGFVFKKSSEVSDDILAV